MIDNLEGLRGLYSNRESLRWWFLEVEKRPPRDVSNRIAHIQYISTSTKKLAARLDLGWCKTILYKIHSWIGDWRGAAGIVAQVAKPLLHHLPPLNELPTNTQDDRQRAWDALDC
jgi:hypothetical protein